MLLQTIRACPQLLRFKLSITTEDSATHTIFIKTEELLKSQDIHREAIEWLATKGKKKIDRYNSLMDFIFCETFTEWQSKCFKYYNGNGCLLKDEPTMTDEKIEFCDYYMANYVLPIALVLYQKEHWMWWLQFQNLVVNTMQKVIAKNKDNKK